MHEEPPPDMADVASIKRPGKWLKDKLGMGEEDSPQGVESSKNGLLPRKPATDQDIKSFLDNFLTPSEPKKKE